MHFDYYETFCRREAIMPPVDVYHKFIDNTYEARLKRLKEELNRPTVTEIIQMHKSSMLSINATVKHSESKLIPLETESLGNDRY